MTDSSALLANTMAVSDTVLYKLKPSAARSRSYRASIAPINASTFAPSTNAIFSIPCGRKNTYIDINQSYFKFSVRNNDVSGNSFYIDNNASCFINRIDTFFGGNLLESLQQYNVLYTYLMDFQTNPSHKVGLANIYGMSPSSDTPSTSRQGQPIFGGQTSTFCMPLLNSLIGIGADKSFPCGFCSSDLRIEISFESQNTAVVYNTLTPSGSWTVIFAELELCYIELQDEAQHMVDSITPHGNVFLHGNSWRHYVSNLPSGSTGVYSTLVPARMASIKSMVLLPRRASEVTSATSYSLSSRLNPCITSFWYRIGSVLCPARPIALSNNQNSYGYSEAFMELQKSFHALVSPEYTGSCTYSNYNVCDNTVDIGVGGLGVGGGVLGASITSISYRNAFALALETESFSGKSNVLLSGLNTLNSNIFFEANIGYASCTTLTGNGNPNVFVNGVTGPTASFTLDFYANFDIIYAIQDGVITARF